MKIRTAVYVSIIFAVFLLTGCINNKADFKLQITESSWSGWTENYIPEEITKEYEVIKGKEYIIDSDNFVFKIKKIKNNSIIIETKDSLSDSEDGIDLQSNKKQFEIVFDKETRLVTPTMDAGDIYYLKLVK